MLKKNRLVFVVLLLISVLTAFLSINYLSDFNEPKFQMIEISSEDCSNFNLINAEQLDIESNTAKKNIETDAIKEWTYMAYIDGDNDLEEFAISDINEMERGKEHEDSVNVIVLVDRHDQYDASNGDWTGAKYYEITYDIDMTEINSFELNDLGEVEMDNPAVLREFLKYCFKNYPAEKYCLDLWNHGAGVFGACTDDTTGSNERLTVNEIQTAIKDASNAYSEHINILAMDCCVMGVIEMAFEVRNYCDYLVTSQSNIPGPGFDYIEMMETLTNFPSISPESFSQAIVDIYSSTYADEEANCLSVTALSNITDIIPLFDAFSSKLIQVIDDWNYKYMYYIARAASCSFSNNAFVDIIDLALNVKKYIDIEDLIISSENLIAAAEEIIIYNWQHESLDGGAHGLSVFMPTSSYLLPENVMYDYADRVNHFYGMDWQAYSDWDEFIRFYYDVYELLQPAPPPFITSEIETEQKSIEGNYHNEFLINIMEDGVYEFKCLIESGDVDLQVAASTSKGFELLALSKLINPLYGQNEICRFFAPANVYYLFITGKAETSSYSLQVNSYDIPTIQLKDKQNFTSCSTHGDTTGHYKQDFHYFFRVDLKIDLYRILLNSSKDTRFKLTIYDDDWKKISSSYSIGLGNSTSVIYNSEEKSTIIIEIAGLEGYGSFELSFLNSKGAIVGFPIFATLLLTTTAFLTLGYIRINSQKRRKRTN